MGALPLSFPLFAGDSLKEWNVIHKIKMLYDGGNGLSIRAIAKETGLSRNTVSQYLKQR
ncbi:MAG: helix-turn-helix domain-containing protein [Vibrio fluvialis]